MKATSLLQQDHRQILRSLDVLEVMAAQTSRGDQVESRDLEDILKFLQAFADRHHQGKEEGVLFPALLQDRGQKNYRDLCAMIFEHNQERSLVEGLEDAIRARKKKDFTYYSGRLIQILRAHIEKEDRVLFPMADEALSEPEDARVAQDMENYERVWQEKVLSGLLLRLDDMESKYLGRTRVRTAVTN